MADRYAFDTSRTVSLDSDRPRRLASAQDAPPSAGKRVVQIPPGTRSVTVLSNVEGPGTPAAFSLCVAELPARLSAQFDPKQVIEAGEEFQRLFIIQGENVGRNYFVVEIPM